ncbi:helix-turn-helix domain-containing protein [Leeia sp. TBRC 13508]|uniref:Helix-turn-helix domain-containing protein n=1 Tax=Leeia speluncae TaxID=2884804 RepID=A0ABS8DA44_9NEIS|nr:helix-turn-helix transcriptional regulator [Leeia speluncae]MCB6185077.1 helix-turn-helix domain-containing protein [Leeia speluncae]
MENLALLFGEKVRSIRKDKGVTQEGLAMICNVDRSYMGKIERGQARITLEMLYLIAKGLQCHPSMLLP